VILEDGTEISSKFVMSNATPKITFQDLINKEHLPEEFLKSIQGIDYRSATMKINGLDLLFFFASFFEPFLNL